MTGYIVRAIVPGEEPETLKVVEQQEACRVAGAQTTRTNAARAGARVETFPVSCTVTALREFLNDLPPYMDDWPVGYTCDGYAGYVETEFIVKDEEHASLEILGG